MMPHRFAGHKLPAIVYAQPFELGIGLMLLGVGLVISIDTVFTPSSIAKLEWPWSFLFRGLIIAAGACMLAGLMRGKHRWSFTIEMAGFMMGSTVFAVYAAGLYESGIPAALLSCGSNLVLSAACGIKARALWIEAHNRLDLIRELPLPVTTDDDRGE